LAQQYCKFQSTQFITQPDQIQHINSIPDFILDNSTYIFVTCIITEVQINNAKVSAYTKVSGCTKISAYTKNSTNTKVLAYTSFRHHQPIASEII
jgi:hypothetical protein